MKTSILVLTMVLASTITGEAASLSGKNLTYCDSNDPKEAEVRMRCWGYVDGFVQGVQMAAVAAKAGRPICLPTFDTENDQAAVRIIIDFEKKHRPRDGLEFAAPLVAAEALIAAYPCKKPN